MVAESPDCHQDYLRCCYVNGVLVQCPVAHPGGPHPTTCGAPGPGCPEQPQPNNCTTDIVSFLQAHRASDGFVLGDTSSLNAKFSRRAAGKAGSFTTIGSERIAVTREDIGSVRVNRCIEQQGVAIFSDSAVAVTGTAN